MIIISQYRLEPIMLLKLPIRYIAMLLSTSCSKIKPIIIFMMLINKYYACQFKYALKFAMPQFLLNFHSPSDR